MAAQGEDRTVDRPLLPVETGLGRRARLALVFSAVWGAVLLLAAYTFPIYSGEGSGGSQTLVGVNGGAAVTVVAFPLVVVGGVWLLLRSRGAWPPARKLAVTLTVVLGVFAFLSLLTVGLYLVPIVVALAVACAAVPRIR